MVSYKFNYYKFFYTADNGQELIRGIRIAKDKQTEQEIIPVSPLFLTVLVPAQERRIVIKDDNRDRQIKFIIRSEETVSGKSEFTHPAPFKPEDRRLLSHIEQLRQNQADRHGETCIRYLGESRDYGTN